MGMNHLKVLFIYLFIYYINAKLRMVEDIYKACPSESGTDKFMQKFI
jgi:hypothetical protein